MGSCARREGLNNYVVTNHQRIGEDHYNLLLNMLIFA